MDTNILALYELYSISLRHVCAVFVDSQKDERFGVLQSNPKKPEIYRPCRVWNTTYVRIIFVQPRISISAMKKDYLFVSITFFIFSFVNKVKINHKSCSSKFIFALVKFINCPIKLYSVNRYHPSHVQHGKPLTNQLVKGITNMNLDIFLAITFLSTERGDRQK